MYGLLGGSILLMRERANDSAVTGHFSHPHSRPWKHVDAPLTPLLAKVLGAQEDEVAHTSTLTSNLHNLFTAFYRPTEKRWKIVIEKGSFPSDWVSQLGMSGC
jgi:kynureninase